MGRVSSPLGCHGQSQSSAQDGVTRYGFVSLFCGQKSIGIVIQPGGSGAMLLLLLLGLILLRCSHPPSPQQKRHHHTLWVGSVDRGLTGEAMTKDEGAEVVAEVWRRKGSRWQRARLAHPA